MTPPTMTTLLVETSRQEKRVLTAVPLSRSDEVSIKFRRLRDGPEPADIPLRWREALPVTRVPCSLGSLLYVLAHAEIGVRWITGVVPIGEEAIEHAWVSLPGGVIYEPTLARFVDAETWATAIAAEVVRTWRPEEIQATATLWGGCDGQKRWDFAGLRWARKDG